MSNKNETINQTKKEDQEQAMKRIFDISQAKRSELTAEMVRSGIEKRKKDLDNKVYREVCMAAYLCGDEEFKQMVIDGLGKDDLAVRRGEKILEVVGKQVEKEDKTKEKSENFVNSLEKKSKQKEGRGIGI